MTGEEHDAMAAMLANMAEDMGRASPAALVAGELLWGATVHACSAIAHRTGRRPAHPRQRRQLERLLASAAPNETILAALIRGLSIVQKRLHNHFYTGQLSDRELAGHLDTGAELVRSLLQISQQS